MNQTLIIAEAGVNHDGDLVKAKELIDAAKESGADVVKFQTFQSKRLATSYAAKADYQKCSSKVYETQRDMLSKLELSYENHYTLLDHCKKRNIKFLSTAFDSASIKFLKTLNLDYVKIPSGEITNLPYLREISSDKKPIFLSTGMADLGEIEFAINALKENGVKRELITVLHCTSEYPAPIESVNLNAMVNIGETFKLQFGYSDHTLGIDISIAAVALGAKIIEKHITLDKNGVGPDHRASLEPNEFKNLVTSIRNIEKSLGDGIKKPTDFEIKNRLIVRQSLVASRKILKGEKFSMENVTYKRPGNGLSPKYYDAVLENYAKKDFDLDDQIIL